MDPIVFLLLFTFLPLVLIAQSSTTLSQSQISIVGVVYCDTCSTTTFSKESYFLAGVEVHIDCRFRETSPRTSEQISLSVNRTTNQDGVYKLDIPISSVEDSSGSVNCMEAGSTICQASLIGISNSYSSCNVPFLKSTTHQVSTKDHNNQCVYTLSGLSYKPPQKNTSLCN
ncbi:uncharacterized protein LOC130729034 [Lotus japonicus]|uniref:uncharacterized protein LOC130729034 n=1 Tax=Lotus japonicus TaxID=34305 RepID=UPI00258DC754|nr:uncharacterized protein LOC130729034 [Lotus japonicus]